MTTVCWLFGQWCALKHVLHHYDTVCPNDSRPRLSIEAARVWTRGEIKMMQARDFAGAAQDAAREVKNVSEAARMAALSAGQAAVVSHVVAHELGAAAYAIRAIMESVPHSEREAARVAELEWQKSRLPEEIHEFALDDMRLRNDICWFVFNDDCTNLTGGL